jgi:hypothetical protein
MWILELTGDLEAGLRYNLRRVSDTLGLPKSDSKSIGPFPQGGGRFSSLKWLSSFRLCEHDVQGAN